MPNFVFIYFILADNFNTYIEQIDFEAWRDVCVTKGALHRFAKGEEFVSVGKVGQYIGFIQSGSLKYVACSADGTEHVMGLVFNDGFVADWPFCIYGQKAKLAIVAVTDCDIFCIPSKDVKELMDCDPEFRDVVMHSTEEVYSTVYDRYVDLQNSAGEICRVDHTLSQSFKSFFAWGHSFISQYHPHPSEPSQEKYLELWTVFNIC